MNIILVLLLLVLLVNTALLVAVAGSLYKLIEAPPQKPTKPKVPAYTVDLPVARQPNYGDLVAMQKPSTDLKLIKDI